MNDQWREMQGQFKVGILQGQISSENVKKFSEEISFRESELIDRSACRDCPEYLKLSQAINEAIKKLPVEDVQNSNLKMIRSHELEFMQAIALSELNGQKECRTLLKGERLDNLSERGKSSQNLRLISQDLAKMTKLGDVQYIDPEFQAVYYYYRGKGANSHLIYELKSVSNKPYQLSIYEDLDLKNSR